MFVLLGLLVSPHRLVSSAGGAVLVLTSGGKSSDSSSALRIGPGRVSWSGTF